MNVIIGLGHRSRVGKDTAALHIWEWCIEKRIECHINSFAAPLKHICHQAFSHLGMMSGAYYEEHQDKKFEILPKLGMSPVESYIKVGEKGREVHPDFWIGQWKSSLPPENDQLRIIVVKDTRFGNEVSAIKDNPNHRLVYVRNSRAKLRNSLADTDLLNQHWYTHTLENEGTYDEFRTTVRDFCNKEHEIGWVRVGNPTV